MACFYPLKAFQLDDGAIVFAERGAVKRQLQLACGQCIGCRLERSRQWAVRCMHESQMHEYSSFVTLTYDDEHLCGPSLIYRDFQLFMKRLRKEKGHVRFYMCGEYGEMGGRPHFHACLFGCFFPDRQFLQQLASGCNLYTSAELSKLWPFGFSSVGDVTFESAAYVARYCTKKVTGANAAAHYEAVDERTGEIVQRVPEFNHMSLKPGIGGKWFEEYRSEVFGRDGGLDRIVMNGVEMRPPRYYDKLLKDADGFALEYVQYVREIKGAEFADERTAERLAVREAVRKGRLAFKKRSI